MEQDFETFFKENERRIHFQIHRLGISGDLYDEFYSEGIIALWKAYQEFDSSKGGELSTFINYKIRFHLIDLLRKKLRYKEVMEEAVKDRITEIDNGNRHRATGMPIVNVSEITLEDNDEYWNEIRKHLSENQWKWVKYFIIADLSVKEIMEIEGVTADAVKGWGRAVRAKLRDEALRRKLERLL